MRNVPHVSRKCLTCGETFFTFNYEIKKGKGKYCSSKCYGASMIDKPARNPNGLKFGQGWNKGIIGKDSHSYGNKFALGNKMTLEQRKHISDGHKGEKSYLWKGGISSDKVYMTKVRHEKTLKRRAKLLGFLGNKCVKCGFSDWRALQIDHVNGGGCKEVKKLGLLNMYKRIYEYPQEYQLLCANCNWIKRYEKGEFPGMI